MALTTEQLNAMRVFIENTSAAHAGQKSEAERIKIIAQSFTPNISGADLAPSDVNKQGQLDDAIVFLNAFITFMDGAITGTGKTGVEIAAKFTLK